MAALDEIRSPSAAHMVIGGREILNFGGSCYLGLSGHPSLIEAGIAAVKEQGSTSQLARHYNFALAANIEAEEAARDFFGTDGAIYFATGYMFGLIACGGLAEDFDVAILDEGAHWNLADGARAAQKEVRTFKHCDADDLESVISQVVGQGLRPLVGTDGMFATIGHSPPLDRYAELLEPHQGWLLVDESHSFGSLGERGRGACEHFGISGPRIVSGGSMGKAFCAHGGLAVGAAEVIAKLWQSFGAKGAVSGTSMGAAMTAASLRYVQAHPEWLEKLRNNSNSLKAMLSGIGLEPQTTASSVCAFERGSAAEMQRIQQSLWEGDIFVIYSRYIGSGPEGTLRIAAFADHSAEDFERLEAALVKLI
ncbi:MAG: pyridoxal phosphate-dependent aminotransferase family protein [Pseudomonadota bacterium]